MDQKIVVYPKTRVIAEGEQIETALTIDLCNLTEQDIMAYAIDSLTIKWQALARKGSVVPTEATYIPNKPGTRNTTGVDITPAKLIKRFGSIEKAIEALSALKTVNT
jgi:hypothetical protein